jgi:predicted ATP-binding protein involved in virulence
MEDIFITKIKINEVRHIRDFEINLSDTERKHLIITGKNGSGKTSVLEELKVVINESSNFVSKYVSVSYNTDDWVLFGIGEDFLTNSFNTGNYLIIYFPAKRKSEFDFSSNIEKVKLKSCYDISDSARTDFVKYMVSLKADKSFANDDNQQDVVENIDNWFASFEKLLQEIFDNDKLKLEFDRKTYYFNIIEENKLPYNLNQLSDGYSAILDIVTELIMRMEAQSQKGNKRNNFDVQGVVLIDELETHLHVDLQKKILPFLTTFFPKIQFIVTTHSPFVINSVSNAVICDLEKRIVTEDLSGYSYDTLIESYFDSDKYSDVLKRKVERYEELLEQNGEGNKDELYEIKTYLNEIPKFVSDELAVKLQQLKLKEIAKKHK